MGNSFIEPSNYLRRYPQVRPGPHPGEAASDERLLRFRSRFSHCGDVYALYSHERTEKMEVETIRTSVIHRNLSVCRFVCLSVPLLLLREGLSSLSHSPGIQQGYTVSALLLSLSPLSSLSSLSLLSGRQRPHSFCCVTAASRETGTERESC